jgi:hypothetical protein
MHCGQDRHTGSNSHQDALIVSSSQQESGTLKFVVTVYSLNRNKLPMEPNSCQNSTGIRLQLVHIWCARVRVRWARSVSHHVALQEAMKALKEMGNHRLDKMHLVRCYGVDDLDRLRNVPDEYVQPEKATFDEEVRPHCAS